MEMTITPNETKGKTFKLFLQYNVEKSGQIERENIF